MLELWMLVKLCTRNSTSAARRRKSTLFAKVWTVLLWIGLQLVGAVFAVQVIPRDINPQIWLVGIWAVGFALAIVVSFLLSALIAKGAGR